MKRWNILALALMALLSSAAQAQAPAEGDGATVEDADRSAQALAVYEEGKKLYDAKDYVGALVKFNQAAELEPGKARWHYNRGLTLRQLNQYEEARQALLQSRALDPEYKRAEINEKLQSMGFTGEDVPVTRPPPLPEFGSRRSVGLVIFPIIRFALCVGIPVLLIVLGIKKLRRKKQEPAEEERSSGARVSAPPAYILTAVEQQLEPVAASLVSVEHALRMQEDADLRALLNQATQAEQRVRDEVERARKGKTMSGPLKPLVTAAEEGAEAAKQCAQAVFGDAAFLPEGERVGCYFCARPLANASFRMQVPLKRGQDVTPVLACPPCANMASAGQPPPMKVRVMAGGRMVHWSELDGYDPYTHRHKPYPGAVMIPAWKFTPERSLSEVAALAAGSALVGGLAAYGVSQLLDLDGARQAAAAQAATGASAKRARERREERDWRDHS